MKATQVKTDFFSRMSHDMRTPMNGILGMTALSRDEMDSAVLHHNLEQIEISGQYMLSLINDTLDLQKLESGKLKLEMQKVYSKDFLNSLIEMMRPTALSKNIQFECENLSIDLDQDAFLDSTRIKQIFVNLLSNAFKFTPEGGTVRFTAECLKKEGSIDHDRFRIIDSGIGMSQEFIKEGIFHPYTQEDSTITSKYGGTGLGLAITKNIIDAMNGSISVESTPGEGTCFTILLDFEVVPHEKTPVEKTSVVKAVKAQEIDTASFLKGKRILICEDHPLNAEIAKRLLMKTECEVFHSINGQLGLIQFQESDPFFFDAVLMDIRMPVMDGLTTAKQIRSLSRADAQSIPIIAMTANAFAEDVHKSREAGMNAHLAKPIDPKLLYETIIQCITKRG